MKQRMCLKLTGWWEISSHFSRDKSWMFLTGSWDFCSRVGATKPGVFNKTLGLLPDTLVATGKRYIFDGKSVETQAILGQQDLMFIRRDDV